MLKKPFKEKRTYCFVDASNLFYGGEKSLGWKIDYQKLFGYLQKKYGVERVLYFGGVEIYKCPYDYLENKTVSIEDLDKYLETLLKTESDRLSDAQILLLERHLNRVSFFLKLKEFGYELYLKPVKSYANDEGEVKRKANCDVDMAFYLMKEKDNFERAVILSGDGDFLPVLKFLKQEGKEVFIFSRGRRTAKEIRQFAGGNFRDFEYLKYLLKYKGKKR
ncbi:MAG: NYN domain-containing protein [bacterium]|nr:NYN domain-containing protein [bacterium]